MIRLYEGWFKLQQARREVDEFFEKRKAETIAKRDLMREARLSPNFFLNMEMRKGVFEDKYYHFMLIGRCVDISLLNIAIQTFFGGKAVESRMSD